MNDSPTLYGPQTHLAIQNFPISGWRMPRAFLSALGLIKAAAAEVNAEVGLLEHDMANAIRKAAEEVAKGAHDAQFPVDVFQTGSATSSNMNANEVIATLATRALGSPVHPNDHVNMGQSSNDVIPSAIHVSAAIALTSDLLPALAGLSRTITRRAAEWDDVVKTGRTHLMDAVPIRLSQELSGWAAQIDACIARLKGCLPRLLELPLGGTAVGTGLNAHARFGVLAAENLASRTGLGFVSQKCPFAGISSQDTALELSGALKVTAAAMMKISNDLRWMNSGPQSGLAEIALPALQPGSSIMPGKVNPVIPEAAAMVAAHVMGSDATLTIAAQAGNFQLNTMLPLIAYHLLTNIGLLARAAESLAHKAIEGMTVNRERLRSLAERSPSLATALNLRVGYDKAAAIVKRAQNEDRTILDVAAEMTDIGRAELEELLDPGRLTRGGLV